MSKRENNNTKILYKFLLLNKYGEFFINHLYFLKFRILLLNKKMQVFDSDIVIKEIKAVMVYIQDQLIEILTQKQELNR
jgi:hypothetical protein